MRTYKPGEVDEPTVRMSFQVSNSPFAGRANIRAAGSDENILLTPPSRFDLEQALEFIDDDELVEITSKPIRLRKKWNPSRRSPGSSFIHRRRLRWAARHCGQGSIV